MLLPLDPKSPSHHFVAALCTCTASRAIAGSIMSESGISSILPSAHATPTSCSSSAVVLEGPALAALRRMRGEPSDEDSEVDEVPNEPDSPTQPPFIPGYASDDLGDGASDAGSDWSLGEGSPGYQGDPLTEADRMCAPGCACLCLSLCGRASGAGVFPRLAACRSKDVADGKQASSWEGETRVVCRHPVRRLGRVRGWHSEPEQPPTLMLPSHRRSLPRLY